ncbi:MAG: M3 family oligoendopeptidase [Eubacteriales bacterium]|nr:M3 family oligoendopeptidase [Eubacteriales bacterium]
MRFDEIEYRHIDQGEMKNEAERILRLIKGATDFDSFAAAVLEFDRLERDFSTMSSLCQIRHSCHTDDDFYKDEQAYYDNVEPIFISYYVEFCKAVVASPFKEQVVQRWGERFYTVCEYTIKSFDEAMIPFMQKENELASEYQRLMSQSQIEFNGEKLTLPGLMSFFSDPDREVRKGAITAFDGFLHSLEEPVGELFDQLVKVRTQMGKAMGFETYTPLAYILRGRYDYDKEAVKAFRDQVVKEVVPLTGKIRAKQAERIGVEKITFTDSSFEFPQGNPRPEGTVEEKIETARKMYNDLNPAAGELFSMMADSGLLDLESRPNKAQGGYCSELANYGLPFIFANFNGTEDDVEVLTHEAGHGYNAWCVRDFELAAQMEAGMETCEIHSTSMEFFTSPYMELFFGERAEDYRYAHLASTVMAIAYECMVDEFQEKMYESPDLTFAERKAVWHSLERKYQPDRDYDGLYPTLESGTYWLRQLHIFMYPFYYIDYALASVSALDFSNRMISDREEAWKDYDKLCHIGGKLFYREALAECGLKDPFREGSLEMIIAPLYEQLGLEK